ncbi:MAG: hypothetical protein ACO1RX_00925 [Candidatus Sericytochromatia bacterium]
MNKSVILNYAVIFGLLSACQAAVNSSSEPALLVPGPSSSTARPAELLPTPQASSLPVASASPRATDAAPESSLAEASKLATEDKPKSSSPRPLAPAPSPEVTAAQTPPGQAEPPPLSTVKPSYQLQLQIPTTEQFDFSIQQKVDSSWAQKTVSDVRMEVETEAVYRMEITPHNTDYRVNTEQTSNTRRVYQVNNGDRSLVFEDKGTGLTPLPQAQPSLPPLKSPDIEAIVSANGQMQSVDLESLWSKVLEAFPLAQLPAELREIIARPEYKGRLFVLLETNIQRHFDTFFGMYPDTAVSPDDNWQARQSLSTLLLGEDAPGAKITSKGTPRWRLERAGNKVELSYQGNLSLQLESQRAPISAREVATVILDGKSGLLESLDFTIEVNLQRNHPHTPIKIHIQRL